MRAKNYIPSITVNGVKVPVLNEPVGAVFDLYMNTVEWLIFPCNNFPYFFTFWVFPFLIFSKRGHMFFFSFLIFPFYVDI